MVEIAQENSYRIPYSALLSGSPLSLSRLFVSYPEQILFLGVKSFFVRAVIILDIKPN